MTGQHSIYRKVQIVIEIAKSANVESLADLEKIIKARNLAAFHTRRFDRAKDTFVTRISIKSIRGTLRLCRDLDLLGPGGALTDPGRVAIQRTKFDTVVATQILSYFRNAGVDIPAINKIILEKLQRRSPELSTSRDIWALIADHISFSRFAIMLNLLALCGGARSSRKKIYLHISPRA